MDLTNSGNNYTGVTDIADGTLRLRGAGLLSASSALRLSGANAILDLNGTNQTVKGFSGTSSSTAKIVNNSGSGTSTITIGTGAANGTYAGQILDNDGVSTGGKVAVIHDAAGITTQLTPTVSNTYSGGTTVKQGTLQGNDVTAYSGATTTAAINPFGSGKITLAGGTLNLRMGAGADTTAQILTLGNDMDVTAASTLNYTRQGGTTANKTLAFGHLNLGAFTLTTVGGNGYVVSFSSATLTGNGTIGGNSQAPMILGAIGESGGSYSLTLNKTGGGAGTPITLTSASTYTGGTNLTGVAVTLQDKAAFGTGTVNAGGGTATLLASKALTGSDKIANNFTNTAGTFAIGGSNDMEFSGTWNTASNRTTNVTNTAKTIFSGAGSSVGILGVSTGTGSIELATDVSAVQINGTGGTINATGGAKLKMNANAGDIGTSGVLTINAEIANGTSNSIDFWNSGGGTVILRGANTWTGVTNIQGAIVDVVSLNSVVGGTASSSLGAPVSVSAGTISIGSATLNTTLKYSGTGETTDRVVNLLLGNATIEHAGTGLLKFTSGFTATGGGEKTFTLSGSSTGVGEIAGAIVDNSTINKTNVNVTGLATWVLSGNNSYTGTTTVSGRMLQVGRLGFGGRTGSGAVTIQSGGAISGTGLVNGATFTAESGSTIYAGDGTAQSDYGTLSFEAKTGPGYFDFKSGSKVILGINPEAWETCLTSPASPMEHSFSMAISPSRQNPTCPPRRPPLISWIGPA
ncbi:beta strand repeat-containing protein [Verrucomicrobium spinosum]|uniref:beta strand repeat-containing protein n=1 Tax=Verrucomicrobium spinosum TaxID=2736 RepID=UPI0009463C63|nr:autotransporter-associated beta strand repeat-containing protein [Verrucomicrobium spinosum]